ncbi:MAG TPA: F0F1 ATP synthase subunit A [Acidimicrobiales bacterium]|jgi:F-type H+-transporting ATPase subunit a|nr:F0F1 ATP synthase subunit A [Acidimicrobiales bacterium]
MALLALEFPPVSHLIEWPDLFGSAPFAVNKVVLLMFLSVAVVFGVFATAGSRRSLVPTGVQNFAESVVEFVQDGIILQTMGPEGLKYTPFLLTMFSFIFVGNIVGIIPLLQMPVNARMAVPAMLALLVWVIFIAVGIKHQGLFGYFRSVMFPPGVPKALYVLVTPIELVSTILVRPLSLAVRLFANMLAGHLLLVSFAVIAAALFKATVVGAALPGALLVALTGFEVLVAVLQAFIFTILAAVYIGGSMHPEH